MLTRPLGAINARGREPLSAAHPSLRHLPVALVLACALLAGTAGCASWEGARLYQSGTRALEAGDVDTALRDLQAAERRLPHASEVQNHLGLAWLAAGDEGRALVSFERALQLDCDNSAARENLDGLETRLRARAIHRVSSSREVSGTRGGDAQARTAVEAELP